MPTAREDVLRLFADYNALESAIGLMNWDMQVLMPPLGAKARTAHIGILTSKAHAIITSDELGLALEKLEAEAEPGSEDAAMAVALRREVNIETKLPAELVDRKARVSSEAYETWKRAKATNDFPLLAPYYEQLFDIARETAELLGYREHVYDALIDLYEQGAKFSDAERMFVGIKQPIVSLVKRIREEGRPVDDSLLHGDWDKETLRQFAERTIGAIGFDFDRGRLNLAPSAFCGGPSSSDIRMTTRASNHLKGILSSSLHEMGHALYEQNSPAKWDRTPLAGGISLAVHESQSRLWENIIGRSRGFWSHFLPSLQGTFPTLAQLDLDAFYRALSKVQPDFVRVGADELTYNLHILVRFELEVEILTNKLKIVDLPEAWNAKYTDYLGITPPTDTLGCLQDVHWSRGSVGYFPTYAMGNLIGGQMWKCLQTDIPNTDELMATGDFAPILGWLVDKVYSKAKTIRPTELVTQVTGRPMEPNDWLNYATAKYEEIYALG
jgi:carboxypeptidase Taq